MSSAAPEGHRQPDGEAGESCIAECSTCSLAALVLCPCLSRSTLSSQAAFSHLAEAVVRMPVDFVLDRCAQLEAQD